jgi:hypothetical protein
MQDGHFAEYPGLKMGIASAASKGISEIPRDGESV